MDIAKAFEKTAQEISKDREVINSSRAEILAVTKRLEAIERLVAGLPPKMDA
jgi:hypothetical protein